MRTALSAACIAVSINTAVGPVAMVTTKAKAAAPAVLMAPAEGPTGPGSLSGYPTGEQAVLV